MRPPLAEGLIATLVLPGAIDVVLSEAFAGLLILKETHVENLSAAEKFPEHQNQMLKNGFQNVSLVQQKDKT